MTTAETRARCAEKLHIEFPDFLPVSKHAAELLELWQKHQLIIVCGATGSGKTTQLPKIALQNNCGRRGMIGCTQPRRIAATAMARRLAQELQCNYGEGVGSQVRFDSRTAPETVLKFMTDGILLAELRNDPLLLKYDCLIIDEVHERSLNIDFLLGIIKNLLPKRQDLKVAISSATLDIEKMAEFFGKDVPVITVEGRTFPVEDIFLPPLPDEELPEHLARAVGELSGFDSRGDILVFLPGEREIRECTEMLTGRKLKNTEILPLYSRLGSAEQQKVFHPGSMRRIILSTNVAETSLTIPRVKFCIDSGLARISRYNPRTRIQELQIEMISRASANQRRGRCGRTADGICVHLYSESELFMADAYTDCELKRTSLAGVILQMAALKLPDIRNFPFIDPPPGGLIREGFRTLTDIRALDEYGRITPDGKMLSRLPVDPHLGRMLLASSRLKTVPEMLILCAALSVPEVRERPTEKPQEADQAHAVWKDENSDYISILNCWNDAFDSGAFASNGALRKFCRKNFLNFTRMREWRNLVTDLADALRFRENITRADCSNAALIHEALLTGIPRNIARFDRELHVYRGCDGKKFTIFPGSSLAKRKNLPEWIVCFALMETSRVFGRVAAAINPETLLRSAPHLCTYSYDQEHFESSSGFVRAREKVSLGSLLIHAGKKVDFARHNPAAAREIFIREGLLAGAVKRGGRKIDSFNAMREKLLKYEMRMRKAGVLYDEEQCAGELFRRLPPQAVSVRALQEILQKEPHLLDLKPADMAAWEVEFDPADYPDNAEFGGINYPLCYTFEPGSDRDGVMICVPENSLNLLPGTALEYPVPGYYADFAEVMLRALPKEIRRNLGGIPQCAASFAAMLKRDPAQKELAPAEVMADFLKSEADIELNPRLFAQVKFPEYLRMKLAVLNNSGKIKEIRHELPENFRQASKLSARMPGADSHRASGWTGWDAASGTIPEFLELPPGSKRCFYPALTVENDGASVGRELFLKLPEAKISHTAGVCTLFMLSHAGLIKMIRKGMKFSNELNLSLLLNSGKSEFEKELFHSALRDISDQELWHIRSKTEFDLWAEKVKCRLSTTMDEMLCALEGFVADIRCIRDLSRRAGGAGEEIREHLQLLFAPGFLKRQAVWENYPRYLRALKLRVQRAADAPGRDLQKGEVLEIWLDRFYAALESVSDLSASPGLYDFWELLEECRISVYTPEIKTAVKSPLAKLAAAWEVLRL